MLTRDRTDQFTTNTSTDVENIATVTYFQFQFHVCFLFDRAFTSPHNS